MKQTPDQAAINALAQKLRPKLAPRRSQAQSNGHAAATPSASQVLEKLFGGSEGQKWRDVYNGTWKPYYGSQSEADAAILHKLAFWTNRDSVQMEDIMRGSKLGREKWDTRRGSSTWLANEIAAAIEATPAGYEQKTARSQSQSLSSLGLGTESDHDLKQSIQAVSFSGREKPGPREWIVENTVWKGHATSWYGEGGTAKSLLALHLALTVAAVDQRYWMAFNVKTVPVLYLDFELDADEQHRRALQIASGLGFDNVPENFYYLSASMLSPVDAFHAAAKECRRLGVGLIIVDSVGFALDGDSETSKDVLGFHRRFLAPLIDAGASPLLIDHQSKIIKGEKYSDKQEFGSVYKGNGVRSSFQVRGSHGQGETTVTFTHKKNNFGGKEKDFSLKVVFDRECITAERLQMAVPAPDREPTKKEQAFEAIEELGRGTAEDVVRKTKMELKTARNAITELLGEGALTKTGEKKNGFQVVSPQSQTTKGPGPGPNGKVPADAAQLAVAEGSLAALDDSMGGTTEPRAEKPPVVEGERSEAAETNGAAAPSFAGAVAALFADIPGWLLPTLDTYLKDPSERNLNPLCAAVAAELYGDPLRGKEIRAEVEREAGSAGLEERREDP